MFWQSWKRALNFKPKPECGRDFPLLIAAYNKVSPASGYSEAADFNCDGVDDIACLLLLQMLSYANLVHSDRVFVEQHEGDNVLFL